MATSEDASLNTIKNEDLYIQEIINYLGDQKAFLEEVLKENDKEKVDKIVNVAKNLKSICQQFTEGGDLDILEFYISIKNKWVQELANKQA